MFIALVCVATRPLGSDPANHSYAMFYNRIAWLLLSILVVQAFFASAAATPRQEALDAAGGLGRCSAWRRTQFWRAAEMPPKINDGLALLRAHAGPDARLMVFALSDPFS